MNFLSIMMELLAIIIIFIIIFPNKDSHGTGEAAI